MQKHREIEQNQIREKKWKNTYRAFHCPLIALFAGLCLLLSTTALADGTAAVFRVWAAGDSHASGDLREGNRESLTIPIRQAAGLQIHSQSQAGKKRGAKNLSPKLKINVAADTMSPAASRFVYAQRLAREASEVHAHFVLTIPAQTGSILPTMA